MQGHYNESRLNVEKALKLNRQNDTYEELYR